MGGRGGRGVIGKENINQGENWVDISDPTSCYGKEEWSRLSCNTQHGIPEDPAREQTLNERLRKKS